MSAYVDRLNAAWDLHLAPRALDAPTVVSTFAGCGGSSLGYSMAGFRELLAVEWDQNAVDTFRLNFPDVPVYHGDIAELSVDECLRLSGLAPGELDVLDGSPPCQGFSTAGKRDMDDDRNQLFREFVRLLRGLQPRVFVMENVSGMVKGKMKLVFVEILRELKASGYRVSARLLNAMYFGVPQSRQRMIFIGVRNDIDMEPSHPKAQTAPVKIANAIDLLANINLGETCQGRSVVSGKYKDGSLEDTKIGEEWDRLKPGTVSKKYFNLIRTDPDAPSPTVSMSGGGFGYGRGTASITHPYERRKFSIAELKRICSFPEQFTLDGTYPEQWARLGNSVPPLFMRAIAEHIRVAILTPALQETAVR